MVVKRPLAGLPFFETPSNFYRVKNVSHLNQVEHMSLEAGSISKKNTASSTWHGPFIRFGRLKS